MRLAVSAYIYEERKMQKMTVQEQKDYLLCLAQYGDRLKYDEDLVRSMLENHLQYIPKQRLYKFRECSEQNFRTLEENCIWMSPASNFPDAFDSTINIDLKKNLKEIENWLHSNLLRYFFEGIKQSCSEKRFEFSYTFADFVTYVNECFTSDGTLIPNKEKAFLMSKATPDELPMFEQTHKGLIEARTQLNSRVEPLAEQLLTGLNKSRDHTREIQLTYCMTERYDNACLWENYADNYTGFCIEYSFDKCMNCSFDDYKNLIYILPMIYSEQKPYFDIVPFMDRVMRENVLHEKIECEDAQLQAGFNMQLYYKNKDYEYEHEWRFSIQNRNNNKQRFPFVKRIIAGRHIAEENLESLKNIAKKLSVAVYRQKINDTGNGFAYTPIQEENK